jgi:glycosyltransferase involved in cell wall biosynthesis
MPYADLFGAMAARVAGVDHILSSRHYDYTFSWPEIFKWVPYYLLAKVFQDSIVAVSERIAEISEQWENWRPSDIEVIPHGCTDVDVDRQVAREAIEKELSLPDDALLLGTVARLIHWKGHRFAIEALRQICAVRNDVYWFFAGDGPERDRLEAQARDAGVLDHLFFLGYRTDIPKLLGATDIFVHPTTGEAFGIAVIEAMAQSNPVVATTAGALPEIVDDPGMGALVPPRSASALANATINLADDPRQRERMGGHARDRFLQCYTLGKMVDQTCEVYRKIATRRSA